jgi:FkbM family methyltransferase
MLRAAWFDAVHAKRPPHDLVCRFDRYRLRLQSDSVIARALYLGRGFEEAELRAFRRFLQPGFKVFDVGANIGLYTVLSSATVGSIGHVWSFEPFPKASSYIRQNVTLNGFTNVTIVEKAVSDVVGHGEMYVFPEGADVYNSLGARTPADEHIYSTGTLPVEVITLDAFAENAGLESVDLIKIDVEGAEERVVTGAQGLLAASKNVTLLLELWEPTAAQCGCSTKRLIAALLGRGFTLFAIKENGEIRATTPDEFKGTYAVFKKTTSASP